eukprot:5436942-Pyramimonas_sp.AAC.1
MLARAGETAVELHLIRPTANFEHWGEGEALTDERGMCSLICSEAWIWPPKGHQRFEAEESA